MQTASLWKRGRQRHLQLIQEVDDEELPSKLHLTDNSKTGISIDFAIHKTCTPTAVCMGVGEDSAGCYALRGFMSFPNAVRMHARNQRLADYLEKASLREVHRVVDALYSDLPRGLDWLRWNGAGDLSPGACRMINAFTARYDDILLWVISRKPDMIAKLRDRKTLKLLMSLDHSTPEKTAARLRAFTKKFKVGKARLAYTRVSEEDVPPKDAWVIFNKHVGGSFNDWPHKNVCPSSLPDTNHVNACDPCRRCFR